MPEETALRILYDLAGQDPALRFSPYCWRIKAALAIKGLAYDTVAVRFADKEAIAFSGHDKVPILRDGEAVVADSRAIAQHLERHYPDRPTLFGAPDARGLTTFVSSWTDRVLHPRLLPLLLMHIHARLGPADQRYFRVTREARLGRSLEAIAADEDGHLSALREALIPLRATLDAQPYLCGGAPGYADCIVFGGFAWAQAVREANVLEPGDPIAGWRERMTALATPPLASQPAA